MICHGHAIGTTSAISPTMAADTPNQRKCTPGTKDSSTNSTTASANHSNVPNCAIKSVTDCMVG